MEDYSAYTDEEIIMRIHNDKNDLKRADYKLSFSRMTFPHQLMQMILLEQIYRSYRIMNHEPYHK